MSHFDGDDGHGGHEGLMNASVGQRSQSSSVDILKKHQSKSMMRTVSQLPDPRAMAEIRSGLEAVRFEAEVVC